MKNVTGCMAEIGVEWKHRERRKAGDAEGACTPILAFKLRGHAVGCRQALHLDGSGGHLVKRVPPLFPNLSSTVVSCPHPLPKTRRRWRL